MVCEYLVRENGKVFCKAYGSLEKVSQEKILECESNFDFCLEEATNFLKENNKEKGIADYFSFSLNGLRRHKNGSI